MNIDDLNISANVKTFLKELGFSTTESLSTHNLYTLTNISTNYSHVSQAVRELNDYGYLLHPQHETSINNLSISVRLKNSLNNNRVFYLSDLKMYTEKEVADFRNIGKKSMDELKDLCKKNDISFYKIPSLPVGYENVKMPPQLTKIFARSQIKTIDEFNRKTTLDLYQICNNDFYQTFEAYLFLKKINISILSWEEAFLFEYLNIHYTELFFGYYNIEKMSELMQLTDEELCYIKGISKVRIAKIKKSIYDYKKNRGY